MGVAHAKYFNFEYNARKSIISSITCELYNLLIIMPVSKKIFLVLCSRCRDLKSEALQTYYNSLHSF